MIRRIRRNETRDHFLSSCTDFSGRVRLQGLVLQDVKTGVYEIPEKSSHAAGEVKQKSRRHVDLEN